MDTTRTVATEVAATVDTTTQRDKEATEEAVTTDAAATTIEVASNSSVTLVAVVKAAKVASATNPWLSPEQDPQPAR